MIGVSYSIMYYEVTAHQIMTDGKIFDSFGIRAVKRGGGILSELSDLSDDFTEVNDLVNLMNREKAELCHFEEVVGDFLFCPH